MGGNGKEDGAGVQGGPGIIDPSLLTLLACPRCDERPALKLESDFLVCTLRGCRYPIVDGIPNLLPEAAEGEA